MTNGGSQGLFIVVAVVIFGIFVAISYIIFRDNLTPSLSAIFSNSISNATNFEQIEGRGEEDDYYFGYYPLKNDNEGMYFKYFTSKETGNVYLYAVYEKSEKGKFVQDSNGYKLKGHLELPDTIEDKKVVGLSVDKGTQTGNWSLSKAQVSSVKLPRFLETIPRGLFNLELIEPNLRKLKSIVGGIPESVTSIGEKSFTHAPLEGELTIPANVGSIGKYAFRNSKLTKVIFKNKNTTFQTKQDFPDDILIEGLTNED